MLAVNSRIGTCANTYSTCNLQCKKATQLFSASADLSLINLANNIVPGSEICLSVFGMFQFEWYFSSLNNHSLSCTKMSNVALHSIDEMPDLLCVVVT